MPNGPGHYETRTRVTIVAGKRKVVTYRVWVPDPGVKKDAKSAQRAKMAAERAAAEKRIADAKKRAETAAEKRRIAADAKRKAEESANYARDLAERRAESVYLLQAKQAAAARRTGIIPAKAAPASGPNVSTGTARPRVTGATRRRAGMLNQAQIRAQNEADARRAQNTLDAQRRNDAKSVPKLFVQQVDPKTRKTYTTITIKTPEDAASIERTVALDAEKAARGEQAMTPEQLKKAKEAYDVYTNGVAAKRNALAAKIQHLMNRSANQNLSVKARQKAWDDAKALWDGDYAGAQSEFARLFGATAPSKKDKKAWRKWQHGGQDEVGAQTRFYEALQERAMQQREWWKSQFKAYLQSKKQRSVHRPEAQTNKGAQDLRMTDEQLKILDSEGDASVLGKTVDHYETTVGPDGKRHSKAIYRTKTIEEALQDQQAQYILRMQAEYDRLQRERLHTAVMERREGNVQDEFGNWVKPSELAFRNQMKSDLKDIYAPNDPNPLHNTGQVEKDYMPEMRRAEDTQRVADELMKKWEGRVPPPPTKFILGAGGAGLSQTLSPEWVAWDQQRGDYEEGVYRFLTQGDQGAPLGFERFMTVPGVSHLISVFQGGVSGIGGYLRVANAAMFGETQVGGYHVNYDNLPPDVRTAITSAGDKFMEKLRAAGGRSGLAGSMGAGGTRKEAERMALALWLKTPAGKAWYENEMQNSRQTGYDEMQRFYEGFYGGKDNAIDQMINHSGEWLDSLNEFGSNPTDSMAVNLVFQMLADPTNAIPLKFTTYLARARYAAELVSGASKLNPLTGARFATAFLHVDEGVLKLEKELAQYSSQLKRLGMTPKEAAAELRDVLGGVADELKDVAFNKWAERLGLNPRKISEGFVANMADWAATKAAKETGQYVSQHDELAKVIAQRQKDEAKAIKARKLKEHQERLAREEEKAKRAEAQGSAQERLAIQQESEIEKLADAAKRAQDDVSAAQREAGAVAGQSPAPGAAREATGTSPARPKVAKKAAPTYRKVTHPVQLSLPQYRGGPLIKKLEEVHARISAKVSDVAETAGEKVRVRRQRAFEGFDEYYNVTKDGLILPKGGGLGDEILRREWYQPEVRRLLKIARKGGPESLEARVALVNHARRVRNMFRTVLEDAPEGVIKTHFTPSFFDVVERAGIDYGDNAARERLLQNLRTTRKLKKRAGKKTADEWIQKHVQSLPAEDVGPGAKMKARTRKSQESKAVADRTIRKVEELGDVENKVYDHTFDAASEVETGFFVVQARESFRGVHEIYTPFRHAALAYYEGMKGEVGQMMRYLTRENWVADVFPVSGFRVMLREAKDEIFGADLVGWRDGGMAMFEVFHQLRLAGKFEKMQDFSTVALNALDEDEFNLFAWTWKVMEHRTGMPWVTDAWEDVVAGFRESARQYGLDPDMALASIPNGYFAQVPPMSFGLSPTLRAVKDSDSFLPAPPWWNAGHARDAVSEIMSNPETRVRPSQVVHYVAERFGDFIKGSPVSARMLDEALHFALPHTTLDAVADAIVRHLPEDHILRKTTAGSGAHPGTLHDYLARAKAVHAKVKPDEPFQTLIKDANGKVVQDLTADWEREVAEYESRQVFSTADRVKSIIRAGDKKAGAGRKMGLHAEFKDIRPYIADAYWSGDLPMPNPAAHELMYLAHMQSLDSLADGWMDQTLVFMKYMRDIGEEARARKFLQEIHADEFNNLAAKRRAQFVDIPNTPADRMTGDTRIISESREWQMWREMGFDPKAADAAGSRLRIMRERAAIEEAEARQSSIEYQLAHERDNLGHGNISGTSEEIMDRMVSRVVGATNAGDIEGVVDALEPILRSIAEGRGGMIGADTMQEVARAVDVIRQSMQGGRYVPGYGDKIIAALRDEIGTGLLVGRTADPVEMLSVQEAALQLEREFHMHPKGTRLPVRDANGNVVVHVNSSGVRRIETFDASSTVRPGHEAAAMRVNREIEEVARLKAQHLHGRAPKEAPKAYRGVAIEEANGMHRAGQAPAPNARVDDALAEARRDPIPGDAQVKAAAAKRKQAAAAKRVGARWDPKRGVILVDDEALRAKAALRTWTRTTRYADGSTSTPLDRWVFRPDKQAPKREKLANGRFAKGKVGGAQDAQEYQNMRRFVLEHEYQHSLEEKPAGMTRGAWEDEINRRAFERMDDPESVGRVSPPDRFAKEPLSATRTGRQMNLDAMREEELAKKMVDEANDEADLMAPPPEPVAGQSGPPPRPHGEEPLRPAPPPIDPMLLARRAQAEQMLNDALGMTEEQWWEVKRQQARKILFNRKSTPAQKMGARETLDRIALAKFGKKVDDAHGRGSQWAKRKAARERVVKAHGADAEQYFPDRIIAPHATDGFGAQVEEVRTYRTALIHRSPDVAESRVTAMGRNGLDYFEIETFDRVETEIADAIRAIDNGGNTRMSRLRRGKNEGEQSLEGGGRIFASRMKDTDEAKIAAKKKILRKYGIDLNAYDEARKVLHKGYVQRKVNLRLQAEAHANVAAARAEGKTLDYVKEYRRLRHARATAEARSHLGELAYTHMPDAAADDVWAEFQSRYAWDRELHRPAHPMSQFQIRTLEEAVRTRSGIADLDGPEIVMYLQVHGMPPFEQGREAVREWLKDTGAWSPRVHDDFVLGHRSWDIDAEAKYWRDNFGYVPEWTNRAKLGGPEFSEIFHNGEAYFTQMKKWGIFNRSNELKLRLGGTDAHAIEQARIHGDAALDIPARRELEAQRLYVVQRYGDLVGEEAADGSTKLTSMPWLMYPDELSTYMATRSIKKGMPDGLVRNQEELDRLVALVEEKLKPLMKKMLEAKNGADITYEDIFHISSRIQAEIMADPIWAKRLRDVMVGDPLDMWTKFNRWLVFSNPSFMFMNMVDVPIKTMWYRSTRAGLFSKSVRHVRGVSKDVMEQAERRAAELTPSHLGIDLETTIYSLKQRSSKDYFMNPREKIRVGFHTFDSKYHILDAGVVRAIESIEGAAHFLPEMAGKTELLGKMNLARGMYPQVYVRALKRLGDPDLADVFAKNFIKNEINRMWPTAGNGVWERLFNRIVPFSSYTVRNKIMFISEVMANPVILNRIDFLGQYIEKTNLQEWEDTYGPDVPMPDYLKRRIRLPWSTVDDPVYLDLGAFSDATRGLKPLMVGDREMTPVEAVAEWVRIINPGPQALLYTTSNAMGLTSRVVYVPIYEDGFPTGEYEKKIIGWTEPWSKDQPGVSSVFWFAEALESFKDFMADGTLTPGEWSRLVGQVTMFNAISTFDKGTAYMQMYKAMEEKDAEAARAWLEGTPEGQYLKDWMKAKVDNPSPRDRMNTLVDMERAEKTQQWRHWFSLSAQEKNAVTFGRAEIKAIRDAYGVKLLAMTPGTQEYQETKAWMYYDINKVYMTNTALMKEEVWSKSPAEWADTTTEWQTDKLTDDYMALSDRRPRRVDFATTAEYQKALKDWEDAKATFLKTYPQVEKRLAGGIVALNEARDKMDAMWDVTLNRIARRNDAIDAAKKILEEAGYDSAKGQRAQHRLDVLYIANELDYEKLNQDFGVTYFSKEDYARIPGKDQTGAPLRDGITIARARVFNDWNKTLLEKARREGTLDDYIANENYGKDMAAAILHAKGGDKFGEFDGGKFYTFMNNHPKLMEKYFENTPGKREEWAKSQKYVDGMRAAVEYAGGTWRKNARGSDPNFDPAKWVAYMKRHPKLLAQYFAKNPGKQQEWARNESYIRQISVWGKLIGAGKYDLANAAWKSLPQWVKDQYYKNNPGRRQAAQQTAEYLGYMKKWVSFFDSKDKIGAMKYFNSLPDWAKERYYKAHPDKRVQYETSAKMFAKLANYFSADDANRARLLKEDPQLAKWLAKNAGSAEKKKWAILAAYQNIPASEAWLRKVYRDKYPEIFGAEAAGERKLKSVYASLKEHPSMSAGFAKWMEAMSTDYAEMLKHANRPLNTYIEPERETPARRRRLARGRSAAETSR